MEPINYQVDVQSPFQAALSGYKSGAAIRDDQLQQQQQRMAMDRQKQMNDDLGAAYKDHSLLVPLMVKYPEIADKLKVGIEAGNAQQAQQTLSQMGPIYAALQNGSVDVAVDQANQLSASLRNSGMTDRADAMDAMVSHMKSNPIDVATRLASRIAVLPGGDKVLDGVKASMTLPDQVEETRAGAKKAKADADVAAVASDFARSNAVVDLQKKGWDIEKLKTDIDVSKQNVRIAALNAQIAREGNQLKREELGLKLQELKDQREEKIRTRAADVESARGSMDNFLNTADRLLGMAVDIDGKPTDTLRAAAGPLDSRMPTAQQDVADLEALAETIGSQAFMSQIPAMKGTGNLSEKEGDKLQSSLQNLNLKQSPEQFIQNIKEAQRLILKARRNVSVRYGVPDSVPDTPAATATPTEVDALIKKYAGGL